MKKDEKKFYINLSIIAIVGVLLRIFVANELANTFAFATPASSTDIYTYMKLSREILNGEFSGPFYYQPFYYAVFLPFCMLIFGKSVWAVVFVQAILGGATIFFSGKIAQIMHSKKAGIITGILVAILNVSIFYSAYFKIATLQTFNLTMIAFFLVLGLSKEKNNLRYFALTGLMSGIAIATRGNIYILLLGIIPLIIIKYRQSIKKCLSSVGILIGFLILAQMPFIIYNTVQCQKLTGTSTASSAVLALGNTPEAPPGGRFTYAGAGPMEYPESYQAFMQNEVKISVPKQILNYLFSEPLAYFELTFRKMLLFWEYGEIPNNVSLYTDGAKSNILKYNIFGSSSIILVMALSAIFLLSKKMFKSQNYGFVAVEILIILYWLSIAMFYNLSRFRAPVLPLCAVFSGVLIMEIILKYQKKEKLTLDILAIFCGIFVVFGANNFYRTTLEAKILKWVRPNGTKIINQDNKVVRFDYGPQTFGNWQIMPLKNGDIITKKFAQIKDFPYKGEVKIYLGSNNNRGSVTLNINNEDVIFDLSKGFEQSLPITLYHPQLDIKIKEVDADGLFIVADYQRNYGRSCLNNQKIPCEFIIRLYGDGTAISHQKLFFAVPSMEENNGDI